MKLAIAVLLLATLAAETGRAQMTENSGTRDHRVGAGNVAVTTSPDYSVFGATPEQESALREQIRLMSPGVLPARVVFVPHWKYLDNARIFQLKVPKGYASVMFTHLPSRTVFVDNDRYLGPEWLGHWMAHELGHLQKNSANEGDAEKAAKKLRLALKRGAQKG